MTSGPYNSRVMSSASAQPDPGTHLELTVAEQLARARPWQPADEPVLDDLSEEEEAELLDAISS